jgi:hypothetical protein
MEMGNDEGDWWVDDEDDEDEYLGEDLGLVEDQLVRFIQGI